MSFRGEALAIRLAENLTRGMGGKREYEPRRVGFYIADVEFSLDRLDSRLTTWDRKLLYPCVVDEDGPVPLDVSTLGGLKAEWANPSPNFARIVQAMKVPYEQVGVEAMVEILQVRLTRFLFTRINTMEDDEPRISVAGGGAAYRGFPSRPSGYLSFQVQTDERGLRIHYTPSYLIDWTTVFGSPTSPVDGWIRPGRYKFAGMRRNGDLVVDNGNVDVPPSHSVRLNM